jgi:hypothetical protein
MSDWNENPRKMVTKHPSCIEVGECRPKHQGGRNTRLWCKGRVGIPHTWEWQQQRSDVEREQHMGLTYHRITEVPICFGCNKIDFRFRSYCVDCGEPWPTLIHEGRGARFMTRPCVRCGAPWMERHRDRVGRAQWTPAGAVSR